MIPLVTHEREASMKRNRLRFLLIGAIVMTAVVGCASGEDRRVSKQPTYLTFADHAVVRASDAGSRLNAVTTSQDRIVER